MCAVTLLYRKGYFTQKLDEQGRQTEVPTEWNPEAMLQPMEPRISVPVEGRNVFVRAFCMHVHGAGGHRVPVYFLDTDLESNSPEDRAITHNLYGGTLATGSSRRRSWGSAAGGCFGRSGTM
jgi:starch phosphorylase